MIILDVREPDEYAEGHVKDAINFSVQRLDRGVMPDIAKDEQIMTYCRMGIRAGRAMGILKEHGYKNVTSGGGLQDMLNAGYEAA